MKKFEFGLLVLCVLVGSYFGSVMGIAIAFATFMVISGLCEEALKRRNSQGNSDKKEVSKHA